MNAFAVGHCFGMPASADLRLEAAMRADAFYHVVDRACGKSLGHVDGWDVCRFETISAVATFAVEVRVHVGEGALRFPTASFVFQHPAAVFDGMCHMLLHKQT